MQDCPRIIITTGEPAGIGPDVALHAAFHRLPIEVILMGDEDLLKARATQLNLDLSFYKTNLDNTTASRANGNGHIAIYPISLRDNCVAGSLNIHNAPYVLEMLKRAADLCLEKKVQAMVTAPVHKALLNESGQPFSGHTEYLGQCSQVKDTLMVFHSADCLMALVTTHLPLNKVAAHITPQRLEKVILQLHTGMQSHFQKAKPNIAILGLNPHAGENGNIGHEEQDLMLPVIEKLKQQGLALTGPLSADTAFSQENRQYFDAYVAMYHDQGLTPMKALYFEELVNITFGLPFLRTSVDHGTALSLAGSGKARPNSLLRALELTHQLIK
ncbi:4-hydroxythreonine-4-phosphate dehydrogenase PdxA [Candidatus Berkiella cookevillensis]|uniref:4-hydroxythreonine-4-phosphate dehydrogenase 1 n=1 Tax=Candidatus Berkiella cookevillensis TaxID=437022 RepID=A0A0Q9YRQ2_9GAMM|nr:4-hydroxythreonine-4-phosphate dehydrogenase PdxA [Candidatus Berkiella cookevillensis]MCS5707483.1 4-hydroxythreonine-4-phosphate dehydrogenase PdxA [Candidatus Berkiella cookevillensis]